MRVIPRYKDTFFTRLILSYTILAVVLVGLAGGYLYTQAQRLMTDEIARDSRYRIATIKNYTEQTLLRKFEDNVKNKAMSSVFIQNNANLIYLLNSGWKGNASRIASFRQDLEFLQMATEGANNITVYFRTGNYVVDKSYFYSVPDHSKDAEFIGKLGRTPTEKWIVRKHPEGKDALTYVVKLPFQMPDALPAGYLFVDVDIDYLKQAAANIMSSPLEKLYIFGADGRLIVQTGDPDKEEFGLLRRIIDSGENVREAIDDKRGKMVLSYLEGANSENGWTYAIVRPMNSFTLSTQYFKTKIFIGCGLVLLLGLLISYLISKRFYNPMKRLVHRIRSLYHPNPTGAQMNEYAIIGSALQFMDQKIETLESLARVNEMKNLVLGAGLGLEYTESLPEGCGYLAAHIHIVRGDAEKFKACYEQQDHSVRYELVILNPKEAAIIYFHDLQDEADDATAASDLTKAKAAMHGEIHFGAAIGMPVRSNEEIPISYQTAQQAYRYRFLYGKEAVILHSKIPANDPAPSLFSFDLYKNALKAGDVNGANRYIDDFAAAAVKQNMQLEVVELTLLQLVSTLYQVVIELELQSLVPPSNLFDELKKETLAETVDSIRALSGRIAMHIEESGNHAHAEVILRLKAYIDEHLHEDLSLNVLSEVASLAPAYISTLFGEVMKESFTEYVTRTRLEKAAILLQEHSRLSVAEIASLVGYRNPQYFHNKFKARFGITPVQYRNAKIKSAAAN